MRNHESSNLPAGWTRPEKASIAHSKAPFIGAPTGAFLFLPSISLTVIISSVFILLPFIPLSPDFKGVK